MNYDAGNQIIYNTEVLKSNDDYNDAYNQYAKFVASTWNFGNDQSNANYSVENEITYSREVSNSNLCDYNDASSRL